MASDQHFDPLQWHDGNRKMQGLMSAPRDINPTSPNLTPFRAGFLQVCNLFAIGTTDDKGRPWTSLWGGEEGSVSVYNLKTIGIKSLVDRQYDPVITRLLQIKPDKDVCGSGQPISGLGLKLATRDRVKLSGTVMGALMEEAGDEGFANASVVVGVESSLGNCPKYLNIKDLKPRIPNPIVHVESLPLPQIALTLIEKADCFFITAGLSTNYRGGVHGFVRILSNKSDQVQLAYPEYSGNRLYQTLGNLFVEPLAGIMIPDFKTGDALYATCEARILAGPEASSLMPRTNLVVVLTLKEARFVQNALPFCAVDGDPSPYNPPLRYLKEEKNVELVATKASVTAELVDRTMLSDDIAWLKFKTDAPIAYKKGQHVALNFESDLGMGYSHMREDDPSSLNDDLNRSFTVTSASQDQESTTFELVIRNVGRVTKHLVKYNIRGGISCSVLGFGGSFAIETSPDRKIGFLAGGVGITPLFCQVDLLDEKNMHMIWTINQKDSTFAMATIRRWPMLKNVKLYVSGDISQENEKILTTLEGEGTMVTRRRLLEDDFKAPGVSKWYVCAGAALQKSATQWLHGKEIISESFAF